MPLDIKIYPQPIARGATGNISSGGGGPISEDQRRTVSGIVFEHYVYHLLNRFFEINQLDIYHNKSLVDFLKEHGVNVDNQWYVVLNNWLLFFTEVPFYELYGYSISDKRFSAVFNKSKPSFWGKDTDRKTAQWLLRSKNVSLVETAPLNTLIRREDFLMVAKSEKGVLVVPIDAKYRSASLSWLTPQDLRRLHAYYKLLRWVFWKQNGRSAVYPYIIGNRRSFSDSIWKRDEEGRWIRSSRYKIVVNDANDSFFGRVEEVRVYARPQDDPNAEKKSHGRFLFSFRYVPVDNLQQALGIKERFLHVIVTPRYVGGKLLWSWHAVSTKADWLEEYHLDAPQWGLVVDGYEVVKGKLRSGNYNLFKALERAHLREEDIMRISPTSEGGESHE